MDDSTGGWYDMILGRDILMDMGLYLKYSEQVIAGCYGSFEGCTDLMLDLSTYNYG